MKKNILLLLLIPIFFIACKNEENRRIKVKYVVEGTANRYQINYIDNDGYNSVEVGTNRWEKKFELYSSSEAFLEAGSEEDGQVTVKIYVDEDYFLWDEIKLTIENTYSGKPHYVSTSKWVEVPEIED